MAGRRQLVDTVACCMLQRSCALGSFSPLLGTVEDDETTKALGGNHVRLNLHCLLSWHRSIRHQPQRLTLDGMADDQTAKKRKVDVIEVLDSDVGTLDASAQRYSAD